MYIQTLSSIVPSQADYTLVKANFAGLKDTAVSGSMTDHIQRMLDNIDTLSGAGSSKTLLDGAGIKASDIASMSPDDRTRLAEKVTDRYMIAIKEAAGDPSGSFADVYGNVVGAAGSLPGNAAPTASTLALQGQGPVASTPGVPSADASSPGDEASVLADLLMRSIAFQNGKSPVGQDT